MLNNYLSEAWSQELESLQSYIVRHRRWLHRHPELSFKEFKTSQYIYDEMLKLPNVEVTRPTETSVLVKITGAKAGKKIGLRADIDALPIQEERPDLEFESEVPGVMHACGHDGHASILMAAMKFLVNHTDELSGEIYGIFQHSEELPPGGAQEMIATGLFDDFDFFYGHHLFSTLPLGTIDIKPGPNSSNSDLYEITIQGRGGHASQPENSIDPVIVGSAIIQQLQTIVSRISSPFDPIVISNTVFQAGNAAAMNVIPDSSYLAGSVRTLTDEARQLVQNHMSSIIKGICDAYNVSYTFDFKLGYDSVMNDETTTAGVREIAESLFPNKVTSLAASLGGEDFSAFSRVAPSTYIWIGARNSEKSYDYPHHHPKFAIDEESFLIGLKMFVAVAKAFSA